MMRVHLACYDLIKPEPWLNIDIQKVTEATNFIQWDLKQGLPPECKDVSFFYSSHWLEHLTRQESLKHLRECFDVMVSGGIIRHCIPDFFKLVSKYIEKDWGFFSHCLSLPESSQLMSILNYSLYQRDDGVTAEHVQMWDSDWAVYTLELIGFKDCKRVECDPEIDYGFRAPYSFFVQGIKP